MKGYRLLPMLVLVLLLSAGTSSTPSGAQRRIEQSQQQIDYAQREKQAPPGIRQRLGALRQEIKARKLTFEVGYTTALS